ncbi:MAG TPA: hypothetical protein VLJ21_03960 [Candidatus Binatia bacterium]|nr:hypothetical protein [Candidatus Binatia bacterium]
MELAPFIFTVFLSSLGLLAGVIVARIAKEELRDGENYFLWLENIILIAVLVFSWQLFALPLFIFLALLTFLMLLPVRRVPPALARLRTSPVAFVLLTLILFTAQDAPTFKLLASFAFLYGLPAGTLLFMRQRNWGAGLLIRIVLMLGCALLFQLLR